MFGKLCLEIKKSSLLVVEVSRFEDPVQSVYTSVEKLRDKTTDINDLIVFKSTQHCAGTHDGHVTHMDDYLR